MDAEVAKLFGEFKKLTKRFERKFKSFSEQQIDLRKKAFSDEFFEENNKLDHQMTEEFFKNDPQVQEDRGKSITVTETTETEYPQDQDYRGKSKKSGQNHNNNGIPSGSSQTWQK